MAPKGTTLELFLTNSSQACQRLSFLLGDSRRLSDLPTGKTKPNCSMRSVNLAIRNKDSLGVVAARLQVGLRQGNTPTENDLASMDESKTSSESVNPVEWCANWEANNVKLVTAPMPLMPISNDSVPLALTRAGCTVMVPLRLPLESLETVPIGTHAVPFHCWKLSAAPVMMGAPLGVNFALPETFSGMGAAGRGVVLHAVSEP